MSFKGTVLVLRDEQSPGDDGGDDCTTVQMHLMPRTCTLKMVKVDLMLRVFDVIFLNVIILKRGEESTTMKRSSPQHEASGEVRRPALPPAQVTSWAGPPGK